MNYDMVTLYTEWDNLKNAKNSLLVVENGIKTQISDICSKLNCFECPFYGYDPTEESYTCEYFGREHLK